MPLPFCLLASLTMASLAMCSFPLVDGSFGWDFRLPRDKLGSLDLRLAVSVLCGVRLRGFSLGPLRKACSRFEHVMVISLTLPSCPTSEFGNPRTFRNSRQTYCKLNCPVEIRNSRLHKYNKSSHLSCLFFITRLDFPVLRSLLVTVES